MRLQLTRVDFLVDCYFRFCISLNRVYGLVLDFHSSSFLPHCLKVCLLVSLVGIFIYSVSFKSVNLFTMNNLNRVSNSRLIKIDRKIYLKIHMQRKKIINIKKIQNM